MGTKHCLSLRITIPTMSAERDNTEAPATRRTPQPGPRSLFAVPTPIKQLFDRFPLLTYPGNDLPQRAPRHRDEHVLHIFATEEGAATGAPSYNPACLKWQVHAIAPGSLPDSDLHSKRPTSSSPTSTSAPYPRTIMHRQVAPFHSFYLPRQTRSNLHSQCRQASFSDGL